MLLTEGSKEQSLVATVDIKKLASRLDKQSISKKAVWPSVKAEVKSRHHLGKERNIQALTAACTIQICPDIQQTRYLPNLTCFQFRTIYSHICPDLVSFREWAVSRIGFTGFPSSMLCSVAWHGNETKVPTQRFTHNSFIEQLKACESIHHYRPSSQAQNSHRKKGKHQKILIQYTGMTLSVRSTLQS